VRTTLTLSTDAFLAAKAKAAHENLSLGEAVSQLILQSVQEERSHLKALPAEGVFRSEGGPYTSRQVEEALDDE